MVDSLISGEGGSVGCGSVGGGSVGGGSVGGGSVGCGSVGGGSVGCGAVVGGTVVGGTPVAGVVVRVVEFWVLPGVVTLGLAQPATKLHSKEAAQTNAPNCLPFFMLPVLLIDLCMNFCWDQPTRPERSMPSVKCF